MRPAEGLPRRGSLKTSQGISNYEQARGPFSILRPTETGQQVIKLVLSDSEGRDPFKGVNPATGEEVVLSDDERVAGYSQFNIKIPPDLLVRQDKKHKRR